MLTLFILAPIVLVLVAVTRLFRLLFFPFRHYHHRGWNRWNNNWNGPTGWGWNQNDYNRGYGRRGSFGGLGSILLLVAVDRLFGRRW